jgi:hypothetical protein
MLTEMLEMLEMLTGRCCWQYAAPEIERIEARIEAIEAQ